MVQKLRVNVAVTVYADADYAKGNTARTSVSGGAVLCGDSAVNTGFY